MNVLVVAPHPDDESIGCGGMICLHALRGDRVVVAFLTSGELGLKHLSREEAWRTREREAEKAAAVLGVARLSFLRYPDWFLSDSAGDASAALSCLIREETPALIYLPHEAEWHPDHKAAVPIARAALRDAEAQPPSRLGYEVWTPLAEYSHVEDISQVMPRKLRAIRCYASQLRAFRYDHAVKGLNRYRGVLAGRCMYAEVFGDVPTFARESE